MKGDVLSEATMCDGYKVDKIASYYLRLSIPSFISFVFPSPRFLVNPSLVYNHILGYPYCQISFPSLHWIKVSRVILE